MTRNYILRLEDIVSAMSRAGDYISRMSLADFLQDEKTQSAVVWQISVVGEATKYVPPRIRAKFPAIPWSEMARMRDKIVHAYFGVRAEIVWAVVKDRFPHIRPQIERIVDEIKGEKLL